jgi:hypothetical protein
MGRTQARFALVEREADQENESSEEEASDGGGDDDEEEEEEEGVEQEQAMRAARQKQGPTRVPLLQASSIVCHVRVIYS